MPAAWPAGTLNAMLAEKLLATRPKKKIITKKRTTVEMRREIPYGKSARSMPVSAKTRQKAKMPAAITEAA